MVDKSRRRHSPAVYRRRRLVLLVALAMVIGVVVWFVVAPPWGAVGASPPDLVAAQAPTPTPTPTPAPAEVDEEDAEAGAAGEGDVDEVDEAEDEATPTAVPQPCAPGAVTVEALTDQDTYAGGQDPQLSIRLTNATAAACTLNVGTSSQRFTITSGSDTWWRSTDCQAEPSDMVVTLEAGQVVESAEPLVWDRTRSNVATCDSDNRPRAGGGGASYHLSVEIGGVTSRQSKQFLLY